MSHFIIIGTFRRHDSCRMTQTYFWKTRPIVNLRILRVKSDRSGKLIQANCLRRMNFPEIGLNNYPEKWKASYEIGMDEFSRNRFWLITRKWKIWHKIFGWNFQNSPKRVNMNYIIEIKRLPIWMVLYKIYYIKTNT